MATTVTGGLLHLSAYQWYGLVIGGCLVFFPISRLALFMSSVLGARTVNWALSHLSYPGVLHPWYWRRRLQLTRLQFLAVAAFAAVNVILCCIAAESVKRVSQNTAAMSVVNLLAILIISQSDLLSAVLGIPRDVIGQAHAVLGGVSLMQGTFHSAASAISNRHSWDQQKILGTVVSTLKLLLATTVTEAGDQLLLDYNTYLGSMRPSIPLRDVHPDTLLFNHFCGSGALHPHSELALFVLHLRSSWNTCTDAAT